MKLTFVTDIGQSFEVEIDAQMELENIMALLEAEVRHGYTGQRVLFMMPYSPAYPSMNKAYLLRDGI